MKKNEKVKVEIKVPFDNGIEMLVSEFISSIANQIQFKDYQIPEICQAVTEACINAIEHSKAADKTIYLTIIFDKNELQIMIKDKGCGFKISNNPNKMEVGKKVKKSNRGWGLKLMKELMDDVKISSGKTGTKITLTKRKSSK